MPRRPSPRISHWLVLVPALLASLVGWLWLEDWSQHGPAFARGLALAQAQTLAITALLVALGVWLLPLLGWGLLRLASRWSTLPASRRWTLAAGVSLGLLLTVAALHWAHKLGRLPLLPSGAAALGQQLSSMLLSWGWQPVTPSLTSELLRWPACALLAWLIYRAVQGRLDGLTHALAACAVLAVMALGFLVSRDKGPLLVAAVAGVCLTAAALRQRLISRHAGTGLPSIAGLTVLLIGLTVVGALLPVLAPSDRTAAWRAPFDARLEYLAEITWFLQAAGWHGFGPAQTPWCGRAGALLGRCLGLPAQTQSDYTFAAMAGLWGAHAAWLVAACVGLALLALLWLASRPRHGHGGVDLGSLMATVGGLYALLMLAQWATTLLGNVGLIPLTGVALPFVSWGRAGLLSLGLALVLVWPWAETGPLPTLHAAAAATSLTRLWSHVTWVAAVFCVLVLLAVPWGLVQLHQTEAPIRTASGRINPWLPLPGCLRAADGGVFSANGAPCLAEPAAPHHPLPADQTLVASLSKLGQAQPLDAPLVHGSLRIPRRVPVQLTFHAALQSRAQGLADCLTRPGSAAATDCGGLLPASLQQPAADRHEGALARSVSIVTVRQSDGAILAAAHQRSPCSERQMAGLPPGPGCPPMAARLVRRPGRQAHQVFHADDMISSTVKPLLAEVLLRGSPAPAQADLTRALVRSDTAYFIDHLLCWRQGQAADCPHLVALHQFAGDLQLSAPMPLWRALPGAAAMTLPGLALDVPAWPPRGPAGRVSREWAAAQACSQRAEHLRWRGCSGEHLAATLAPLWGQGEARSHPLAVAGLYLQLAAAARGNPAAPVPHLWAGHAPPDKPAGFTPAHARVILQALRDVPVRGTAASACVGLLDAAECARQGWAMKTGTSLFPHHTLTAEARAALCARVHGQGGPAREQVACALYPMKWAVLLEDAGRPEARLTVVLAERNWSARTGLVDAGDDRAPNVAAQAAVLLHAAR